MKTKTSNLQSLIKLKNFDYVNSDINSKNFSSQSIRSSDYKVFHFDRYISSDDAIKEIEKEGYFPANIYELLSWGDWNEKDFVIALGSVAKVDGNRGVPCLRRYSSERSLSLSWRDDGWPAIYRFLAFRNLESGNSEIALSPSESLTLESRVKSLEDTVAKLTKVINI